MAKTSNNDVSSLDDDAMRSVLSDEFPNDLRQIISIKAEDSILQEVSEQIKCKKSNNQHRIQDNVKPNAEGNIKINSNEKNRIELQKQVESGEITPFEAVFKQSALEQKEGSANKDSQLLDLEKYFKQQAALTEQKRKLKKISKTPEKSEYKTLLSLIYLIFVFTCKCIFLFMKNISYLLIFIEISSARNIEVELCDCSLCRRSEFICYITHFSFNLKLCCKTDKHTVCINCKIHVKVGINICFA